MDITNFSTQGSSKKRELSNQSNNGSVSRKTREIDLEDSHVLNSSALEDVFVSSLKA